MKLFFALITLITLKTHAAEFNLASITSNIDTDTTIFYLETNSDGSIDSMRYVTTLESGQISEDMHFTVEDVLDEGVVLEERNGHEIVRLYIEDFQAASGGLVRLNYLVNGATSYRRELRLKLIKLDNQFVLTDMDNNFIDCMYLRGNWIRFFGLVGVRDIEVQNCKL